MSENAGSWGGNQATQGLTTEVSVTLKAGPGYDAPWFVIKGESVFDVKAQLENQSLLAETSRLAVEAGVGFSGLWAARKGLGGQTEPVQQQQAPPPQQQQGGWQNGQQSAPQWSGGQQGGDQPDPGPPGPAPSCGHGEMIYKSGISNKNHKRWRAWTCPANQCDRQWIRG